MTESTTNGEHLALWGGRFKSGPSPELARLSKSTQFDWRLADDDIAGSRAHARALGRAGLLTADELQRMEDALDELQRRVDSGAFAPIEDDEDEATALERGLLQIAGDELGGKLRAGRSRNDQIAALIRMWLRRHSRVIAKMLLGLAATLTEQAEKAGRTVMPGRTHMQHAQPVLLAHQLMATCGRCCAMWNVLPIGTSASMQARMVPAPSPATPSAWSRWPWPANSASPR